MRLRNKINLYTTVLFIFLLIVMNLVVYYLFNRLILYSELEQAQAEAENVVLGINESIGTIPTGDLLRSYAPVDGMIRVVTSDNKGPSQVTSSSEKHLTNTKAEFFQNERSEMINFDGRSYTFVSIPIIWNNGEVANLQILKSLQREVDNLRILRIVLIIVTVAAMVPVIISSTILSRLITTPISSLTKTMTEIQKSGKLQRIPSGQHSKDELALMGATFNHMIDILESNSKKQEEFVSNASHELKTPLTVINSYASLLKRRWKDEPKVFEEAVEAIQSEAIRMREMTEQLLLLAKPNEQWSIEVEPIQLAGLVRESIKAFQKGYGRDIVLNAKENIIIQSDRQRLKQLLYILLDNAFKYSEETIVVTIDRTNSSTFLKIIDRGIGIPKEDLSRIFDRFYRVDKARSRKLGGTGLGLALAKELAEAIGATITIDSLEGVGTTVTISFIL